MERTWKEMRNDERKKNANETEKTRERERERERERAHLAHGLCSGRSNSAGH